MRSGSTTTCVRMQETHNRISILETSLQNLNHGQGLGFVVEQVT